MANEYLTRRPTSTGNRKVWTWSTWLKLNDTDPFDGWAWLYNTSVNGGILINFDLTTYRSVLQFYDNGGTELVFWNPSFRDVSSWYHLIVVVDTTLTTGIGATTVNENRVRAYINGAELEPSKTLASTYPIQNKELNWNNTIQHSIGRWEQGTSRPAKVQFFDQFMVDGQALTPDVFGFYKEGKGYISAGSTQSTDFRPGQWVPKTPRVIKAEIERNGGFGVNGFYLPMNDSSNFGADFHCEPNSIITLKGEDLPQPRNGAPTTTDAYVSQLRADPYAANLVLALPFVSGGSSSGLGDYSANIKGSGSNKTITNNSSVSIANTHGYYGSSAYIDGVNYLSVSSADFAMGTGDFTVEGWINQTGGDTSTGGMFSSAQVGGGTGIVIARDQCWLGSNAVSISVSAPGGTFWPLNQWTHIAFVRKTNTLTVFVNGVAAGIATNVTINVGETDAAIGRRYYNNSSFIPIAYIQDLRVYKGVAKYTGGFDVPKPYTPVGISTWRAVPDTTANNFATLNSVVNSSNGTNESFSNGNLTVANGEFYISTVGLTTGKWYWEYYESAYTNYAGYGIDGHAGSATTFASRTQLPGAPSGGQLYIAPGRSTGAQAFRGTVYNTSETINITHPTITLPITSAGTVYAVALDLDSAQGIGSTGAVHFYINGTRIDQQLALPTIYQGISTTGNVVTPFTYAAGTQNLNFGQNPTFSGNTTAGTYTDSNGKGLFKYQPPSGFLALCEDNLPTPAISDPGEYFKTVLYTGSGSARSITGIGFTPDLVWIKERTSTSGHIWFDSVRGAGRYLFSVNNSAEDVVTGALSSFDSDGFSIAGNNGAVNESSSQNYVAWCWRAGAGTTSTNTDGSIQSVISVNQDAGFSIVSYTGTGANATVGHGLGKAPAFVVVKARSLSGENWNTWHKGLSNTTYRLQLNTTIAVDTGSPTIWSSGGITPTTTTFTVGTNTGTNGSGATYIAYCWAEIEGFSKAFSYTGNGSADGPFVFLNFRPAFVMYKRTDTTGDWAILDSSRQSTNPLDLRLFANNTNVDTTGVTSFDFLSNGFKIRDSAGSINASGGTYIGMAFAESPFVYSNSK